jgi:hypothetical protein
VAGWCAGPGGGPASATGFVAPLAALGAARLVPAVVIGQFADYDPGSPVNVVHIVHLLY